MRTTIDIPEKLIKEAMRLMHTRTKTETIRDALALAIRHEKIRQLMDYKGKVDLELDLDVIRKR